MIYTPNNNKNAIIKPNKAMASVKANPKIARRNNSSFSFGLRETANTRDPKIFPIPNAAPANPILVNPAPINFAAVTNIYLSLVII